MPGVTTPLGLAAYTGVPLTHREHTSAVAFVTGHDVDASTGARSAAVETIVVFMGLVNFPAIARELMRTAGRRKHRRWRFAGPRGPISKPSWERCEDLPGVKAQRLKPPATIVIGEVVALRERFNWYERLPLFGQRIVVTRDRNQAMELAEPLGGAGGGGFRCFR